MNPVSVLWDARFRPAYSPARLARAQAAGLARLRRRIMPKSPFYAACAGRPLAEWPQTDKAGMMENFTAINTLGITKEAALALALQAETSRDFAPMIGEAAVGLSTGTSGQRGLFLSGKAERALWAALMVGRFMPTFLRHQRVAFFLRANNPLYESLNNPLISFGFYDLLTDFDAHLPTLQKQDPTILIAPAQILCHLARMQLDGRLRLTPQVVISVAEVATPEDAALIRAAFDRPLDQVYQCTEGVLGLTCRHGRIHLNEQFLLIEREVIDPATGAFVPVITDLARESLPIIRYRLDDVLVPDPTPCPCGCARLSLQRIEGRCDDILYWQGLDGVPRMIPSDAIRQAVAQAHSPVRDYRAVQRGRERLEITLDTDATTAAAEVSAALRVQAARYGAVLPDLTISVGITPRLDLKRRRVINLPPEVQP